MPVSKSVRAFTTVSAILMVVLAFATRGNAQDDKKPPDGTAATGSHDVTATPKCNWKFEQYFVVKAQVSDKDRKALEVALDALVKVLGAAEPEVKAVETAINTIGVAGSGDLVDVYVICACEDAKGKVVKRHEDKIDDVLETVHWTSKSNLLTGSAKDDNERARKRIVDRLCGKLRQP